MVAFGRFEASIAGISVGAADTCAMNVVMDVDMDTTRKTWMNRKIK